MSNIFPMHSIINESVPTERFDEKVLAITFSDDLVLQKSLGFNKKNEKGLYFDPEREKKRLFSYSFLYPYLYLQKNFTKFLLKYIDPNKITYDQNIPKISGFLIAPVTDSCPTFLHLLLGDLFNLSNELVLYIPSLERDFRTIDDIGIDSFNLDQLYQKDDSDSWDIIYVDRNTSELSLSTAKEYVQLIYILEHSCVILKRLNEFGILIMELGNFYTLAMVDLIDVLRQCFDSVRFVRTPYTTQTARTKCVIFEGFCKENYKKIKPLLRRLQKYAAYPQVILKQDSPVRSLYPSHIMEKYDLRMERKNVKSTKWIHRLLDGPHSKELEKAIRSINKKVSIISTNATAQVKQFIDDNHSADSLLRFRTQQISVCIQYCLKHDLTINPIYLKNFKTASNLMKFVYGPTFSSKYKPTTDDINDPIDASYFKKLCGHLPKGIDFHSDCESGAPKLLFEHYLGKGEIKLLFKIAKVKMDVDECLKRLSKFKLVIIQTPRQLFIDSGLAKRFKIGEKIFLVYGNWNLKPISVIRNRSHNYSDE